jgi:hypothetical protein
MPKVCRDYPNCSNNKCAFLHPIIVEEQDKTILVPKPETKYEKPEPVPCCLYRRKNLGIAANTVRGAVFSIVKGLTDPFTSLELAISWIREHGEKDYVYQIRVGLQAIQHWVFDDFRQWHKTDFRQDQQRGYKSDKNPKLRIH